jgi:hypothetical protein
MNRSTRTLSLLLGSYTLLACLLCCALAFRIDRVAAAQEAHEAAVALPVGKNEFQPPAPGTSTPVPLPETEPVGNGGTPPSETESESLPLQESEAPAPLTAPFWLRADGRGEVALYDDAGRLLGRLGVRLANLPAADRAALERGIRLNSLQEVVTHLQDYTG